MKILVIGSGGREHALVWKISKSKLVDKIFCAPGNGGIAKIAECVDIEAFDIARILDFARSEKIDLTVVGPEVPLANGIVDEFEKEDLKVFGPCKKAAQLEASKVFAKELMARHNIPTAGFKTFDDSRSAIKFIEALKKPCVVKAEGLASGKGVIVARNVEETIQAVKLMLDKKVFGAAAKRIVVEELLLGEEASILVFTDSKEIIPLASSQDHKRIFDNDQGPNTGGMGAYSPAYVVNDKMFEQIVNKIIQPTIKGLVKEGINYKGVLYAGVMITDSGPKVLEFNCRFGDPETQAILPRLESDIVEVMLSVANGTLSKIKNSGGLSWSKRPCVCVVCSSKGYPAEYEKDKEISGLETLENDQDIVVFHAGTKLIRSPKLKNDYFVTSGGRVLGVTGLGEDIKHAIDKAYQGVAKINFDGMYFRKDIAYKALRQNY